MFFTLAIWFSAVFIEQSKNAEVSDFRGVLRMTVFLNTVVCRSDVLVWLQCVAPYVGSGCFDLILCPVTISSGETHVPIPNTLVKT